MSPVHVAQNVDLRGYFKKATRFGWSVSRYVTFDSTGFVEWSESDEKGAKKSVERVLSVQVTAGDAKEFTLVRGLTLLLFLVFAFCFF